MTGAEVYAVVYVGCIECGVPTSLVGVYADAESAQRALAATDEGGDSWARHGGQGYVAVFGPAVVGATRDPSGTEQWPEYASVG